MIIDVDNKTIKIEARLELTPSNYSDLFWGMSAKEQAVALDFIAKYFDSTKGDRQIEYIKPFLSDNAKHFLKSLLGVE